VRLCYWLGMFYLGVRYDFLILPSRRCSRPFYLLCGLLDHLLLFFSPFILTPPIVLLGMGLALFLEMGFGLAYLAATCYLIHTEMHLSLYTYLSFSGLCQISSGLSRNQKGV
jgi:hypothetical protein